MKNTTGKRAPKRTLYTVLVSLCLLLAIFGTAYAVLHVDTVEIPSYQEVNDTTAPVSISSYTETAAEDTHFSRQWNMDDTNLDVVWNTFRARLAASDDPVFVVVMEECIDLEHADLSDAFYQIGEDTETGEAYIGAYLSDDMTMRPLKASDWKLVNMNHASAAADYDKFFHGSHVAGIVGAAHNTIGVAGASPSVYMIPVFTGGIYGEEQAFDWVIDELYGTLQALTGETPRIIIQRAWGTTGVAGIDEPAVVAAFDRYKRASDAGILVVHGAGNVARDLHDGVWQEGGADVTVIPSCGGILAENFLSVAAHGVDRTIYPNSNYSTAGLDAQVHLSAPGWKIVSSGRNGEYWVASGTSMAAPHVSGTAALLWQLFPDASAAEIKTLVLEGAKVSNSMAVAPHSGQTATTIGGYVRTGYLDAAASVKKSKQVLGVSRGLDINIPVKEVVITPAAYSIVEGDTTTLTADTILPFTADNKALSFVSNFPSVAWVAEANGIYTIRTGAVAENKPVQIYATAEDGSGTESNIINITVTNSVIPAESLSIKHGSDILADNATVDVVLGETLTLEPVVTPADATVEDADFSWSIDPNGSFTVNGRNMVFTPTAEGIYNVTLEMPETEGITSARCIINVTRPAVSSIEIEESGGYTSLPVDSVISLTAAVGPLNADYEPSEIRWTAVSGNPLLSATSGGNISVTLRYAGTVTVRATLGSRSDDYTITVTGPTPDPTPGPTPSSGGGCSTGPATGFTLLIMSIIPLFCRKKK